MIPLTGPPRLVLDPGEKENVSTKNIYVIFGKALRYMAVCACSERDNFKCLQK
jgi:hypothetical protein